MDVHCVYQTFETKEDTMCIYIPANIRLLINYVKHFLKIYDRTCNIENGSVEIFAKHTVKNIESGVVLDIVNLPTKN